MFRRSLGGSRLSRLEVLEGDRHSIIIDLAGTCTSSCRTPPRHDTHARSDTLVHLTSCSVHLLATAANSQRKGPVTYSLSPRDVKFSDRIPSPANGIDTFLFALKVRRLDTSRSNSESNPKHTLQEWNPRPVLVGTQSRGCYPLALLLPVELQSPRLHLCLPHQPPQRSRHSSLVTLLSQLPIPTLLPTPPLPLKLNLPVPRLTNSLNLKLNAASDPNTTKVARCSTLRLLVR